jgi:hypothetical protein
LKHAVIVAGHSILRMPPASREALTQDDAWLLLDFQKGEPPCYLEHARCGVEIAARDPEALLLFSGGQSRAGAGPWSEAQSYYLAAAMHDWFGHAPVAARASTEEFARDSFENLLCGLARFREWTGVWPAHVTVVSWAFKEERFGLHRAAIRWPAERFHYEGPNNPRDLAQALAAEQRARQWYTEDPYSSGERFRAKRVERNPHRRAASYLHTCPELRNLFAHAGPERFTGALPWD